MAKNAADLRRLRVRFSTKRKDDAEFLAALDERCSTDSEAQDFLRRCILVGYALQCNTVDLANQLATYTNKSHHAQTDAGETLTPVNEARENGLGEDGSTPQQANGVRGLMGLLGSGSSATAEVS
ncbi:MAG: hypothetical protein ACREPQ_00315 [Rhodanobacter sp.]